ncbi:hypothetical protein [Quadrisphaera sp. DSM 44207]|uniref:hypothetical protein n=1 Tax=Quadrisphaera sp. DSM 44207 TaxID=1881057 RepID=UPI0008870E0F|nr:hypothetical protein [Quadrisphaera sp. DSM 44207]SDQ69203.1 hypothetical protein SAMN05428996_2413 [Quadrisphaera sp. DSM 44207]
MTALALLVALLAVLAVALPWLVHEVSADGYGVRPAPPSSAGWGATALPSAPYAAELDR